MDIRKIIREEVGKIIRENYPTGAANDPSAPWNQVDNTRDGNKASEIKYSLIWTDENEFAFFKDSAGNTYVFYIDSVDKSEFEPYADREETFLGRDEDGDADIEYGDWEITSEVIENYVNDNLNSIRVGKGLGDYESGNYDLVMLDDELKQDLASIAKFMSDEKKKNEFLRILSGQVSEGGILNKIVDTPTMDTPTGTIFVMDIGE